MGTEITRAGDLDRERYIVHLTTLFSEGFITQQEAEALRNQIDSARSLKTLDDALDGFPPPPPEIADVPFDWGIPEHFVPATAAMIVAGVLVAVVPVTALAHHGDTVSNVLSATCIVVGMLMVIAAIVWGVWAAWSWDDVGPDVRRNRQQQAAHRR